MKNVAIILYLMLTLISCAKKTTTTYNYTENGKKFNQSRLPLKINVTKEKYERYETEFHNVENDVRSESGKQLVEFVPVNGNPKFADKWDSLSLYDTNSEIWVLFREDSTQFTNLDEGNAAEALTWTYNDGTIDSAQIIIDFTTSQWSNNDFNQVLFHETLHILGFTHTFENDYSVMNYDFVYNIYGMTNDDSDRVTQKYNFSLRWDQVKDLERLGYTKESLINEVASLEIEETYGLSEERSLEVAKILNAFQKYKKKRALTDTERNIMTKKLLGIDFKTTKLALDEHIQGNPDKLQDVLEIAAEINNTSPEHIQELIGEYLLN